MENKDVKKAIKRGDPVKRLNRLVKLQQAEIESLREINKALQDQVDWYRRKYKKTPKW
jgi:TPP-dependent pyruvate/acetoin dehydrogenase alpha subunit